MHSEYELQRTLIFDESVVKNDYFEVGKTGTGIGRKIFNSQVETLVQFGFEQIKVSA